MKYVLTSLSDGRQWDSPKSLQEMREDLDWSEWRKLGDVELREV